MLPIHLWVDVLTILMIEAERNKNTPFNDISLAVSAVKDICNVAMVCKDLHVASVEVLTQAFKSKNSPMTLMVEARRQKTTSWKSDEDLIFAQGPYQLHKPFYNYVYAWTHYQCPTLLNDDVSSWETRAILRANFGDDMVKFARLSRYECLNCGNGNYCDINAPWALYPHKCCQLLFCNDCCKTASRSNMPCMKHQHRIPKIQSRRILH